MSVSRPWKALERRHAKRMDGTRIWRQDFSEVAPDGETSTDVWDAKCYKRFSVVEMFIRCEAKYRAYAKGRRFHLVLFSRAHPRAGDFVVLRANDFEELVRLANDRPGALVFDEPGFARAPDGSERVCGTCRDSGGPHPECPDPACGL